MEIGIVGLGRMGANMARRLARGGARVVCYDQADAAREALAKEAHVDCAENLAALCARLTGERVIVLSLPAGAAVEDTIRDLLPLCSSGDTVVDCGNSYYRDSMRRALALSQQGLRYIDAGISGGIHGRDHVLVLNLRVGADRDRVLVVEPAHEVLPLDNDSPAFVAIFGEHAGDAQALRAGGRGKIEKIIPLQAETL